jgi:hypothetical protein
MGGVVVPARLKLGTKDTCRNCDMPIAWQKIDDVWNLNAARWMHTEKRIPETLFYDTPSMCVMADEDLTRRTRFEAEPSKYCAVFQHDTTPRGVCNRRITDTEKMLCGMHARHERKNERERERSQERNTYDVDNYVKEVLNPILEDLNKYYGLEAELERGYRPGRGSGFTGKLIINGERLMELIGAETEVKVQAQA